MPFVSFFFVCQAKQLHLVRTSSVLTFRDLFANFSQVLLARNRDLKTTGDRLSGLSVLTGPLQKVNNLRRVKLENPTTKATKNLLWKKTHEKPDNWLGTAKAALCLLCPPVLFGSSQKMENPLISQKVKV